MPRPIVARLTALAGPPRAQVLRRGPAQVMAVPGLRGPGKAILALVVFQFALGATNVLLGLPLVGAVLHNAAAMLLLGAMVVVVFRIQAAFRQTP